MKTLADLILALHKQDPEALQDLHAIVCLDGATEQDAQRQGQALRRLFAKLDASPVPKEEAAQMKQELIAYVKRKDALVEK